MILYQDVTFFYIAEHRFGVFKFALLPSLFVGITLTIKADYFLSVQVMSHF